MLSELAGGDTSPFGCAHMSTYVYAPHTCCVIPLVPILHQRACRYVVLIFSWRGASQVTRRRSACHVHALLGAGPPRLFVLLWPHPASPSPPLRLQHGRGHYSGTPCRPGAQRRCCAPWHPRRGARWRVVALRAHELSARHRHQQRAAQPAAAEQSVNHPQQLRGPMRGHRNYCHERHACMPARDTSKIFSLTDACERLAHGPSLLCDVRARQETRSAPAARMLTPLMAAPPDVAHAAFYASTHSEMTFLKMVGGSRRSAAGIGAQNCARAGRQFPQGRLYIRVLHGCMIARSMLPSATTLYGRWWPFS